MELKRGVRDGTWAQGVGSVHRSFASKLLLLMRFSKGSPVCGIESWSTRRTPRVMLVRMQVLASAELSLARLLWL